MINKLCSKCKKVKPVQEFSTDKAMRCGYRSNCRECGRISSRAWKESNTERLSEYYKQQYRERKESGYIDQWKEANRDKVNQYRRDEYARDIEHSRELGRMYANKRRSLVNQSVDHYTVEQWNELCARYSNRCLRCGSCDKLTVDHIIPISRGGGNGIDNIQPLCMSCNLKKRDHQIDYRSLYESTCMA